MNTMPKVIEKEAAVEEDDGSLPSDNAINKTQMINDVFDSIFKADTAKEYNLVSERSNRTKPPINTQANPGSAATDKLHSSKLRKTVNPGSFNSKSIEIKKSLSISIEKQSKDQDNVQVDDYSISESEQGTTNKKNKTSKIKQKKPSSPVPFSATNEQSLIQQIFLSNQGNSQILTNQ